jgi:hypothetical protein
MDDVTATKLKASVNAAIAILEFIDIHPIALAHPERPAWLLLVRNVSLAA